MGIINDSTTSVRHPGAAPIIIVSDAKPEVRRALEPVLKHLAYLSRIVIELEEKIRGMESEGS